MPLSGTLCIVISTRANGVLNERRRSHGTGQQKAADSASDCRRIHPFGKSCRLEIIEPEQRHEVVVGDDPQRDGGPRGARIPCTAAHECGTHSVGEGIPSVCGPHDAARASLGRGDTAAARILPRARQRRGRGAQRDGEGAFGDHALHGGRSDAGYRRQPAEAFAADPLDRGQGAGGCGHRRGRFAELGYRHPVRLGTGGAGSHQQGDHRTFRRRKDVHGLLSFGARARRRSFLPRGLCGDAAHNAL